VAHRLHRFEALKVPRQQGLHPSESDFVQRLLNEARIAAQLHHPHIVGIHHVSDAEKPPCSFFHGYVAGYDMAQYWSTPAFVFQEGLPSCARWLKRLITRTSMVWCIAT
jgi:serine/threonine protein kinase